MSRAGLPTRPSPLRRWRRTIFWLGFGMVLLLAAWLWISGLIGFGLQYLGMQRAAAEWQHKGLWLPFYAAGIEARPVAGLEDNLSGLTWSAQTGTLFAVINRPPAIAELSPEGRLLRLIPVSGLRDPEGITHVEGPVFVISDEAQQSLSWVTITPETRQVDAVGMPHISLNYGSFHNMGFEGVSWDGARDMLFIAQEMWPVRVLTVTGLSGALRGEGFALSVSEWLPGGLLGHFVADLSSLTVHDATGNLLLLSHLTGVIAEYAPDGTPVSVMPLWRGWHGLQADIPQAEGLAVDDQGDIYLVSEPNLFYRFHRTPVTAWAGLRN